MLREANSLDNYEIVNLLQILRSESPAYNYVDNDPDFVRNNLELAFENNCMFGIVSTFNDDPLSPVIGFMLGQVGSTWYSRKIEAIENILYIHPAYRKRLLAVKLIKEFELACIKRGATALSVGASTGMNDERTEKLYQLLGYKWKGKTLVKEF